MPKIAVLIFNDGRNDYLVRTLDSFFAKVKFPEKPYLMLVDDCPQDRDLEALEKIKKKYKINKMILNDLNYGIHKAVQKGWYNLPKDIDFVWHCENDFEYTTPIKVADLLPLASHPKIFQVSLLRQAWYQSEVKAGGIIQQNPEAFKDGDVAGMKAILHREYFTHNPCLYHKRVIDATLLDYNEHTYRKELLKREPNGYFAIWGNTKDLPRVMHIGEKKQLHLKC